METFLYLVLALAVVGVLAYAVYQVTVRQQRILAEITRLERLTAEVTMSAEALLDEIDERMARLNDLAAQLEIRAVAEVQAQAQSQSKAKARTGPQAVPQEARYAAEAPSQQQAQTQATPVPAQEEAQAQAQRPPAEAEPARQKPKRGGRVRTGAKTTASEVQTTAEPETETQPLAPADRYGDLRQAVWRLADEGWNAVEIAETLGVPRGEVLLMLNLRGKKAAR